MRCLSCISTREAFILNLVFRILIVLLITGVCPAMEKPLREINYSKFETIAYMPKSALYFSNSDNRVLERRVEKQKSTWALKELPTWKELATVDIVADLVLSPKIDGDGKQLAAITLHNKAFSIEVYDIIQNRRLHRIPCTWADGGDICFLPDGNKVACSFRKEPTVGTSVGIWDLATEQPIWSLTYNPNSTGCAKLRFSPNGKFLLGYEIHGPAIVWDAQTGKQLVSYPDGYNPTMLEPPYHFSHDSAYLVSVLNDRTVRLFDLNAGQEKFQIEWSFDNMAMNAFWSTTKQELGLIRGNANTGWKTRTFCWYDIQQKKERSSIEFPPKVMRNSRGIGIGPVDPSFEYALVEMEDGTRKICELNTGKHCSNLELPPQFAPLEDVDSRWSRWNLRFSPTGRYLIASYPTVEGTIVWGEAVKK